MMRKKKEAQEAKQSIAQELSYRAASLLRWGRLRTEVAADVNTFFTPWNHLDATS
jgi:hypothetical protein